MFYQHHIGISINFTTAQRYMHCTETYVSYDDGKLYNKNTNSSSIIATPISFSIVSNVAFLAALMIIPILTKFHIYCCTPRSALAMMAQSPT